MPFERIFPLIGDKWIGEFVAEKTPLLPVNTSD
jgi:hypothetical protein